MRSEADAIDKVLDKTDLIINALSEKLGTTVGNLWEVLLGQTKIEIINYIIMSFILIFFIACAAFYVIHARRNHWYAISLNNEKAEAHWALSGIIIIVLTICSIVHILDFKTIITCLYNPEYYALDKILKQF